MYKYLRSHPPIEAVLWCPHEGVWEFFLGILRHLHGAYQLSRKGLWAGSCGSGGGAGGENTERDHPRKVSQQSLDSLRLHEVIRANSQQSVHPIHPPALYTLK